MAKITIDIERIKENLENIGYEITDCIERNNNGKNWQFKFSNSGAIVTIYDSNVVKNSVVNGKCDSEEKEKLKAIVDGFKSNEIQLKDINKTIVNIIRTKKEDYFYDFNEILHKDNEHLLHDILCLSNNLENKDAYLIIGVRDDYEVIGINDEWKSNNIYDFIKTLKFAGDRRPNIQIDEIYFMYKKIMVIKCIASSDVPFYLEKRYKGINDHQIYTRVGDTNTPRNQHASYNDIERLWSFHFNKK